MAGLTVTCYTLLLFFFQPLGHDQSMHSNAFNLHILGMWVTFLVSAVLITSFVTAMSASIRVRDRELANATVERLGGSVALFNRDGGGGCTRVTIPLAIPAAHA